MQYSNCSWHSDKPNKHWYTNYRLRTTTRIMIVLHNDTFYEDQHANVFRLEARVPLQNIILLKDTFYEDQHAMSVD